MGDKRRTAARQGRRILVISNETVLGTVLHEAIRFRARNLDGEVLVVAPALNTRLRHWTSDVDGARREAGERLERSLRRLAAANIHARGHVGDADPMQAIADALAGFAADEIIVATHPEHRSHWLAHDLVARARARFGRPVLHVVVDLERQAEYVEEPRERRFSPPVFDPPTLTAS
jgi:GNAT superfamily N-acetyltransferase